MLATPRPRSSRSSRRLGGLWKRRLLLLTRNRKIEQFSAGRVKEAYEVLQEMKKKGFCPDVSFYNYLMEACCRDDLLRPAKRLWDEMFASGCGGNLKTWSILIQKFSQTGQVEEAQRLFGHMLDLDKGLIPNATTYTSLLEGLCKEKKIEDAIEMFNKSVEVLP